MSHLCCSNIFFIRKMPHFRLYAEVETGTIQYVTTKNVVGIIHDIGACIHTKMDYLTELDSPVGDGDHGVNLDRGFQEVLHRLNGVEDEDLGSILEFTGSTLLSTTGGASGALYGTAFQRASYTCRGKYSVGIDEIAQLFQAAEEGIVNIGNARLGDKTILDVLHPAAEAAEEARSKHCDLIQGFEEIVSAAESGLEKTKGLVARRGRAMYLGERAMGHYDVGAASLCLILRSTLETLKRIDVQPCD